jgi:hypothetical protein
MSLIRFSPFITFKDYEPTNFQQSILLLSHPYSMRYRKNHIQLPEKLSVKTFKQFLQKILIKWNVLLFKIFFLISQYD